MPRTLLALLLPLLISACATAPSLDTAGVDRTVQPNDPATELDLATGRRVLWGGVVIESRNLSNRTRLEILAYPVDTDGRPDTTRPPLARFLAEQSGYLETLAYPPGRLASFVGRIQPSQSGKVGDTEYRYPTLAIEQTAIWPSPSSSRPNVRFGIGIGISR